ncbi:general substrate transporter [Durotheca rogersii]|uniref:general substrate transporter n=1 Tax=Durotheca rogersii TaxID=419775 RepID=UPI0022209FB6|nr:general substrate transporter [Durotheca rogersii]KAI5867537.1 general substrate transporter [Durotheca rogersii]
MFFFNSTLAITACVTAAMFSMADLAYDASIINQLLLNDNFRNYFQLNSMWIGLNTAMVNVGGVLVGPFTGPLLDWVGRKRALVIGNCIALIGAAIQSAAPNEGTLLGGRFILGLALVITGVAGPALVAESTPAKLHGLLTNCIIIGLPIFGTISAIIAIVVFDIDSNWGWRGALMGDLAAPLLSLLCLLFAPESPRWLAHKGRMAEARQVLERMHTLQDPDREAVVEVEYGQIVQTIKQEHHAHEAHGYTGFWSTLAASAADRRRFAIAVLVNIFCQVSGANTFPFFLTLVLQQANMGVHETLYINLGLCIWGAVSVAVGIWACDYAGAKRSLLFGTTLITVCLALLAVLSRLVQSGRSYGIGCVALLFVFQSASFGTWMILLFAYPPMILRYSQRASGLGLAQSVGYGFLVMMTYTLPTALENLEWRFYAINAAWNIGIIAIIWWLFVEIKGKTLEEISALFDSKVPFEDQAEKGVIEGVPSTAEQADSTRDKAEVDQKDKRKEEK